MFLFVIPVLLLASRARSIEYDMFRQAQSAASDAQIRFAIENKYDDTGPGAKGVEYAYDTYKTLEDALVGYIDDPDTKLPEQEKAKGVQKLYKNQYKDKLNYNYRTIPQIRPVQQLPSYSKNVLYNSGVNLPVFIPNEERERQNEIPPSPPAREEFGFVSDVDNPRADPFKMQKYHILTSPPGREEFSFVADVEKQRVDPFKVQKYQIFPSPPEREEFGFVSDVEKQRVDQFKRQKFHSVKGNPLNLAHFKRDQAIDTKEFDANPSYSYSYGVHDKMTGDSKSAHETRDGDKVTGFYTFMDADGKQRSVHYTADDKQGFRAVVRRTATNSQ